MGRRWGHLLSERQGNDPEAEQHAADLHATLVKAHVMTIAYPGRVEHRVHPPPAGAVHRVVSVAHGRVSRPWARSDEPLRSDPLVEGHRVQGDQGSVCRWAR